MSFRIKSSYDGLEGKVTKSDADFLHVQWDDGTRSREFIDKNNEDYKVIGDEGDE